MNVDRLRFIDLYIGLPLCYLGSLLRRLTAIFRSHQPPPPVKRILFMGLSEMGGILLATPAMKKARDHFQGELYFLTLLHNRSSLELIPMIAPERIFTIRQGHPVHFLVDIVRFIFWCRKNQIDTVVDLELFVRFSALLSWLSGACRRVGFHGFFTEGLYIGDFLTHMVAYNPHLHIAGNYLALSLALTRPTPEHPYVKVQIDPAELTIGQHLPSQKEIASVEETVRARHPDFDPSHQVIVLINPEASGLLPQRRWPRDYFETLIQQLLKEGEEILILLTGGPEEISAHESLCQKINHPRCINFAGALKLGQMPTLYHQSAFMVTNDSGPNHFAAVSRMPTIALYGPETPKLYGSLGRTTSLYAGLACSPCVSAANHRKTPCNDPVCLKLLTPKMVLSHAKELLQEARSLGGQRP
ncbi:MAG: glycosyltransferase family 9 protein [Magnetococcales bacterium]|nr:glycosyltransferase family 9 protein [Magnetococcales bacterium]